MNENIWDWGFVVNTVAPVLFDGLLITLQATALGALLAFSLGLVLAVFRFSFTPLKQLTRAFVEFVRSTPLLVQLYFLFYALPQTGFQLPAFATGVIGIGIHFSTYASEVYRAGIEGVPKGQWEAATALSLPRGRTWTSVILPQAIPRVLPALGNYVIMMFKYTPLLSAITILDLVGEAENLGANTFRYVEPLTLAGLTFLVLSLLSAYPLRRLERRLGH